MIEDNVSHIYKVGDTFLNTKTNELYKITGCIFGRHGGINYTVLIDNSLRRIYSQSYMNHLKKL